MRVKLRLLSAIVLCACLGAGFLATKPVFASTNNSVGVSPALESLTVLPKQTTLSYHTTITNNTNQFVTVSVSTANFTTVGLYATLSFINQANPGSHALASDISTSAPQFTLAARTSKAITVLVRGLSGLSAGGHYAALLFSVHAVPAVGKPQVSVHQTVASLLFLTTSGNGTYGLRINPIHVPTSLVRFPNSINLVFNNTGNVQTVPRGYIVIDGPFHTEFTKSIVNPNSALLLPSTERLLQTSLTKPTKTLWPGVYSVHVFYRYDGATNFGEMTTHFFYLNVLGCLLLLAIVTIVIIIAIRYIFSVQMHTQKRK